MNEYRWKPIEDLPEDWSRFSSHALASLASIWKDQAKKLIDSDALRDFNDRLKREWAIETGIIENLYTIDRGVTQILIERGIEENLVPHGTTDKPVGQVISILKDQQESLEGIFDFVKNNRTLSCSYIKELHQLITRHQHSTRAINTLGQSLEINLLKGDWKKQPNNPTRLQNGGLHEYCPPEQVQSEMERLISLHQIHVEMHVPPEIEAAWLHHRFIQIHPFQDGNGRVARTLASFIFIKAGRFPLVITRDMRSNYISASEKADENNLGDLIELFISIQKRSLIKSLSISENVLQEKGSPIQEVIFAAANHLRERKQSETQKYQFVFSIADHLVDFSYRFLSDIRIQLEDQIRQIDSDYRVSVNQNDSTNSHWFKNQIIKLANELDYYADSRTYARWIRLKIEEQRQSEIVFTFHSLGVKFLGLLAVTSFIEYRDHDDDENRVTIDGPYALCEEIFPFSYQEQPDEVKNRFSQWINKCMITGLDQWRRQL